ncbi:hypothetical protein HIV01_001165 [Lysobacter arenosi]|uniref:Phage gp6-like head-tail connector protein n=1 Tax=Lysobacter arenosi TaxID=2795387 RepID=A0ABX7RCS8_9GAMM|nr:hypothetical protein [Lysobacter arenosi]QSX75212.1 hypothetical protein HIV01_001165 [Lysobacter arenosi]
MQLSRAELDRLLASLDEAIVLMRTTYPDRDDLLVAFASAADAIRVQAGTESSYVSARLLAIAIANGLGPVTLKDD